MTVALSDEPQNLRRALIGCLLVFCFETYVGNQVAALAHAQSGITLLYQWKPREETSTTINVESPAPNIIEDELIQAFTRLDLQVSIILDIRPLKFHRTMKQDFSAALQKMPTLFKTLEEARVWSELLMRWNYHFRGEAATVGKSQEIGMNPSTLQWEGTMDTPMGANVLHESKEVPVSLLPEYEIHVSKMKQWFLAFEPLFASFQITRGSDIVGGVLLQVQARMSTICLASAFFTGETGYDSYLPEFRDIITLMDAISDLLSLHAGKRLYYHIDTGFTPVLFLVATKCRDRVLRRKAIDYLYWSPVRDGVFDSICCGKMAEWMMAVEQEGIAEGDIPDHRRLRVRRSNVDLLRRRVHLQVTQFKNADDPEPELRETVLTW